MTGATYPIPTFAWTEVPGAASYEWEIWDGPRGRTPGDLTPLTRITGGVVPLGTQTAWDTAIEHWGQRRHQLRVRALDGDGTPGDWSEYFPYVTPPQKAVLTQSDAYWQDGVWKSVWNWTAPAVGGGAQATADVPLLPYMGVYRDTWGNDWPPGPANVVQPWIGWAPGGSIQGWTYDVWAYAHMDTGTNVDPRFTRGPGARETWFQSGAAPSVRVVVPPGPAAPAAPWNVTATWTWDNGGGFYLNWADPANGAYPNGITEMQVHYHADGEGWVQAWSGGWTGETSRTLFLPVRAWWNWHSFIVRAWNRYGYADGNTAGLAKHARGSSIDLWPAQSDCWEDNNGWLEADVSVPFGFWPGVSQGGDFATYFYGDQIAGWTQNGYDPPNHVNVCFTLYSGPPGGIDLQPCSDRWKAGGQPQTRPGVGGSWWHPDQYFYVNQPAWCDNANWQVDQWGVSYHALVVYAPDAAQGVFRRMYGAPTTGTSYSGLLRIYW